MAKKAFLITVGLVLGLALGSSELVKPILSFSADFRAVRWGMTFDEVKRSEEARQHDHIMSSEERGILVFDNVTEVLYGSEYRTNVQYIFDNSYLVAGCYDLNPQYSNTPSSSDVARYDALASAIAGTLGMKANERRNISEFQSGTDYDLLSTWNGERSSVTLRFYSDIPTRVAKTAYQFRLCYSTPEMVQRLSRS